MTGSGASAAGDLPLTRTPAGRPVPARARASQPPGGPTVRRGPTRARGLRRSAGRQRDGVRRRLGRSGAVVVVGASAARPVPTRTWITARSTPTRTTDQNRRDTETLAPHSSTMTPSTPTTIRSQSAFASRPPARAGHRGVGEGGPDRLQPGGRRRPGGDTGLRAAGEPADHDQDQAQPEHHALAALEVGEQGVVEDPAGRAEHRAGELVDEQLSTDREQQGDEQRVRGEHGADDHRGPRPATRQQQAAQVEQGHDREQPLRDRVAEGVDRADLLQLRRLAAARSAGPRPGSCGAFWTKVSPRSTSCCFTWSMTSERSRTTCAALHRTAPESSPFRSWTSRSWARVFDCEPELTERVRGDEVLDLRLDQPVDGAGERSDQELQPRPVLGDARERLVEQRLDVDLLLDGVGDLGGDRRLHLGRVHQRAHRRDVPRTRR